MSGAITSLKNNKALRKVDTGKWKNYLGGHKKPTKKLGEVSDDSLKDLRYSLKKRNKRVTYIQVIVLLSVLLIIIYIMYRLS